jgi:hypothetical protein
MAALFRHRTRPPTPALVPDEVDAAGSEECIRMDARNLIVAGFRTRDEVEAIALELADNAADPIGPDLVEQIVAEQWQLRLDQLAKPPSREPTDDVRVATAFARLGRAGVIASMNLGATREDGIESSKRLAFDQPDVRGFALFAEPDGARLGESGATLHVSFGAIGTFGTLEEYEARNLVIATITRDALEDEGLTVRWDGSSAQPIEIVDLDWRRPLPEPKPEPEPGVEAAAEAD